MTTCKKYGLTHKNDHQNFAAKKQGSEVCQQISFHGPFNHGLHPFKADIANSGICEQDAKPRPLFATGGTPR